jgi:hypothetical protein
MFKVDMDKDFSHENVDLWNTIHDRLMASQKQLYAIGKVWGEKFKDSHE